MPRVFVSGGHGGLAQALCDCCHNRGWQIDAPDRTILDISDRRCVETWFATHVPYDLIVCAAGITCDQFLLKQTESNWDGVMAVNLTGAVWCARSAVQQAQKAVHVVFIGSYVACHPGVSQILYASSKAALVGTMKSLAAEWGGEGTRVNLILPGFMLTNMTDPLTAETKQAALSRHVLGQFNSPDNTARFICFLHETMTATSGQIFNLDSRIL